MKTMTIGELKSHFSEALGWVQGGEEIVISFGKRKKKVAVLVPYDHFQPREERKLGLLAGKAECTIKNDFSMNDEELLDS